MNDSKYACIVCRKENVKLWRPYSDTEPLICAECAEKRQAPKRYYEMTWEKTSSGYLGTPTGKKLPLTKWKVDDDGFVPSYRGLGPDGLPLAMTDQLIIDIRDISKSHYLNKTTMIPAIMDSTGEFFGYHSVSDEDYERWQKLPTRI